MRLSNCSSPKTFSIVDMKTCQSHQMHLRCIRADNRNFTFDQINHEAARAIAEVSAEAGVARLIHVSALNADENSPSKFLKTKVCLEFSKRPG